jgi:hypothetical protein
MLRTQAHLSIRGSQLGLTRVLPFLQTFILWHSDSSAFVFRKQPRERKKMLLNYKNVQLRQLQKLQNPTLSVLMPLFLKTINLHKPPTTLT